MFNLLKKFFGKNKPKRITLELEESPEIVAYGNAEGLFMFRDEIFFKFKNAAGRNLMDNTTFTDSVRKYPDYYEVTAKEISEIRVSVIRLVEHK